MPALHWGLIKAFLPERERPLNTAIIASYAGISDYGNTSWGMLLYYSGCLIAILAATPLAKDL